jgi:restriction system protein
VLLIVDEAERLSRHLLSGLLNELKQQPERFPILISRQAVALPRGYRPIHLRPFDAAEFRELLLRVAEVKNWKVSAREVEEIFQFSRGSPRIAIRAVNAISIGAVQSLHEFFERARSFQTSGLLGSDGKPLAGSDRRKLIAAVKATNDEIIRKLKQEPELARSISPRHFEELVAELLDDMGFEVALTPPSRDGGFDMRVARKDGLGSFLFLVECKRFADARKVGVNVVRSLHGVVQQQNANAGAIVTTSFFSSDAKEFRQTIEHQMHLHDYVQLQKWVKEFPKKSKLSN